MTKIAEGEIVGSSENQLVKSTQQNNEPVFYDYEAPEIITQKTSANKTTDALKAEIEAYIREVFEKDGEKMLSIAKCESGLNPQAINWGDAEITGMPSHGIFQLNMPYNEDLFDWKKNVDIAYSNFYLKRGTQPWSCARILGL